MLFCHTWGHSSTQNLLLVNIPHSLISAYFRHAVCYAPSTFASLELIERAFSELFFCRVIRVDALRLRGSDNHWAYYYSDKEVPFLSLRCVQQCELLYVHGLGTWYGMFNVDLLGWLDSGEEKKKLTLEVPWTFVTLRIYSRRLIEVSGTLSCLKWDTLK